MLLYSISSHLSPIFKNVLLAAQQYSKSFKKSFLKCNCLYRIFSNKKLDISRKKLPFDSLVVILLYSRSKDIWQSTKVKTSVTNGKYKLPSIVFISIDKLSVKYILHINDDVSLRQRVRNSSCGIFLSKLFTISFLCTIIGVECCNVLLVGDDGGIWRIGITIGFALIVLILLWDFMICHIAFSFLMELYSIVCFGVAFNRCMCLLESNLSTALF